MSAFSKLIDKVTAAERELHRVFALRMNAADAVRRVDLAKMELASAVVVAGTAYTRADLVRAILGQQWAVAVCLMDPGDTDLDATSSVRRIAALPSPEDVVTAMEQP